MIYFYLALFLCSSFSLLFLLQILPKVYYELTQVRDGMDYRKKELVVFDNAIEEIEKNYGEFLYSPEIFKGDA